VRSQEAGERVLNPVSHFIENKLKLIVNKEKSKACDVNTTKLLGHTIQRDGAFTISSQNQDRLKVKTRRITKRNRGENLVAINSEMTNAAILGTIFSTYKKSKDYYKR
jgi:RNA-directed DNA polymerase